MSESRSAYSFQTLTSAPSVGLVFTVFLNIVVLLAKPTVVIVLLSGPTVVIVQPPKRPVIVNQNAFLRFFGFRDMTPSGFETIPSDFETISSDIEWFAHQIQRKARALHPSRPNVGDWEPSVGLLLFTRPTVGQCCWPGPVLFCCYC